MRRAACMGGVRDGTGAQVVSERCAKEAGERACVNRSYSDAVWSTEAVKSMDAKVRAYKESRGERRMLDDPALLFVVHYGSSRAVRAFAAANFDLDAVVRRPDRPDLLC